MQQPFGIMAVGHLIWSCCASVDGTECTLGGSSSSIQDRSNGEGECQGLAKAPQPQRMGKNQLPQGSKSAWLDISVLTDLVSQKQWKIVVVNRSFRWKIMFSIIGPIPSNHTDMVKQDAKLPVSCNGVCGHFQFLSVLSVMLVSTGGVQFLYRSWAHYQISSCHAPFCLHWVQFVES